MKTKKVLKVSRTCYSAAYVSQTQAQQRFAFCLQIAISEVAANWYELK